MANIQAQILQIQEKLKNDTKEQETKTNQIEKNFGTLLTKNLRPRLNNEQQVGRKQNRGNDKVLRKSLNIKKKKGHKKRKNKFEK